MVGQPTRPVVELTGVPASGTPQRLDATINFFAPLPLHLIGLEAMHDDDTKTPRCPLTLDWIRGHADLEVKQLTLIEIPRRLAPPEIVVRAPSSTVARTESGARYQGDENAIPE